MIITRLKNFLYLVKKDFRDIFFYPNLITSSISYDDYWNFRKNIFNGFKKNRAKILIDFINLNGLNNKKIKILDIGSGLGDVYEYCRNYIDNSITLSENMSNACQKLKDKNFDVLKLSVLDNIDYTTYDIVTCFEVLEHISTPEIFIENFLKYNRKYLLFSVPNSGFWLYRIRFLFGRFPIQWKLHPGEHVRFWTFSDMNWWLSQLGIKQYKISFYSSYSINNCILPSMFHKGMFVIIKT